MPVPDNEDWFELAEADPVVEIVPTPKERALARKEDSNSRLRALEDQVFEEAGTVVLDALQGLALDPSAGDDWDETLGPQEAARRRRTAAMGLLPTSEVPHALKMAESTFRSISRGRMNQKGGDRVLNVQVINMPAVNTIFPELEVGDDK